MRGSSMMLITIRTKKGKEVVVYFDISGFFPFSCQGLKKNNF